MSNETTPERSPWSSSAIPEWTRAPLGAATPAGDPAVFRSSPHAWFALRLAYLADVAGVDAQELSETTQRYEQAWQRYVRHGADMQQLASLIDHDVEAAASFWNSLDQCEIDAAFSAAICEREPFPRGSTARKPVNLATRVQRHYGLRSTPPLVDTPRDRKLRKSDNQLAWDAAAGGRCKGCDTPTISQRQYDRLMKLMAANHDRFDLSPTYPQHNGVRAPLWSRRILIAAKGVADHIVPWSHGGPSHIDNLANVCAACNYSRGTVLHDTVRAAAYRG